MKTVIEWMPLRSSEKFDRALKMAKAHAEFMAAASRLSEVWDEEFVYQYPGYLPSFDEFVLDMANLMIKKEVPNDNEAV